MSINSKNSENYWLLKTEPATYSIDDLKREGTTRWDGIRNYQARNFLRDGMKKGDAVIIYHSSTGVLGAVGIGKVVSDAYADPTQFDSKSKYFDPKATRPKPRWFTHDISFKDKFKQVIPLSVIKRNPTLRGMYLVGSGGGRLSVQPVSMAQYKAILAIGEYRNA